MRQTGFVSFYLLLSIFVVACNDNPDHLNVQPDQVKKIISHNGDNVRDYSTRVLTATDSVRQVCLLLNEAELVSGSTASIKETEQSIWIDIYFVNDKTMRISCNVTFSNGTILWYEGSRFRANTLYEYIK